MPEVNEVKIGSGTSPASKDGKTPGTSVDYFRAQMGDGEIAKTIIIVRDSTGAKLTHSDTVEGLRQAGYSVTLLPEPEDPETEEIRQLKAELDEANEKVDEQAKEIAELKKDLEKAEDKNSDLEKQLDDAKGEIEQLKTDLASAERTAEEHRS